jgi:nickel-type superoxide dismutase maturation protease
MQPLLHSQEEVFIHPYAYQNQMPRPGDLVVVRHPQQVNLRLIKWVVYVEGSQCFVKGLNPIASTDSRDFGLVSQEHLLGKVLCRFP